MGKKGKVVDPSRGITLDMLRADHTACLFFMSKKRRFCNLEKVSGADYCGVHRFEVNEKETGGATTTTTTIATTNPTPSRKEREAEASGMKLERIPCPIDPTHSIYAHQLKRHTKICNTLMANKLMEAEPYYCLDCNSGTILCDDIDVEMKESAPLDADVLLQKITNGYTQFVEPLLNMDIEEDVAASNTNDDIFPGLQSFVVNELTEKTNQTSFNKVRHATQDAKIIKQMLLNGLFEYRPQFTRQEVIAAATTEEKSEESIKTFFVELGAGSGLLGYASHICTTPSHLIMVERGGLNNKIDKRLRREGSSSFHRARMDIRNTKVSNLPEIIDQIDPINVIVIAKHLCGVASDLAINSLKDPDLREKTIEKFPGSEKEENKIVAGLGLAVATCCHHACVYDDYAGKKWLTSVCGISREEFDVLKLWTSWATAFASTWTGVDGRSAKQVASSWSKDTEAKARSEETDTGNVPSRLFNSCNNGTVQRDGKDKEDEHIKKSRKVSSSKDKFIDANKEEHTLPATAWKTIRPSSDLTDTEMARIGFMCKRLLDHGRVVGLQEIGHASAKQVRFCNPIDSPECYMLVA